MATFITLYDFMLSKLLFSVVGTEIIAVREKYLILEDSLAIFKHFKQNFTQKWTSYVKVWRLRL